MGCGRGFGCGLGCGYGLLLWLCRLVVLGVCVFLCLCGLANQTSNLSTQPNKPSLTASLKRANSLISTFYAFVVVRVEVVVCCGCGCGLWLWLCRLCLCGFVVVFVWLGQPQQQPTPVHTTKHTNVARRIICQTSNLIDIHVLCVAFGWC